MSKYDKAGLVQIPSGYKAGISAGTLYSVVPTSSDGDFDVTRASTATRVNKDGLIETVAANVPRLDYPLIDGVVQDCPALLLEPQRTNLVTYSEDFSQGYWSKIGSSISPNVTISPNGTQNASKLVEDNLNGLKRLRINAVSTSGDNTLSFFVKSAERNWILLREAGQTGAYAYFDLENGVIGQSNLAENINIEQYNNNWYKISFKDNLTSVAIELRLALSDGVDSYQGDGTSGIYIWGAQVEAGSYATSYIPTSGSAVTRSADVCGDSGTSAEINSEDGVLYIETSALANDLSERRFGISDGGSSNVVRVGYTSVSNRIIAVVYNGSNQAVMTYTSPDITANSKIAVKYKVNDFALWVDGVKRSADTSGVTFAAETLNSLDFNVGGGSHFYSKTKQVTVFTEALSDTELESLTSWTSFNEMATGQGYSIK